MTPPQLPAVVEPARLTAALRKSGVLDAGAVREVKVLDDRDTLVSHITRLGLLKKFRDIPCCKGVVFQAGFQPLKPESRQHQQPRDECNQQPGHKQLVNTAKVSAGSRISTLSR